jgi:O-antigen ligase
MLRHAIIGLAALSALAGWAGFVWRIDSLALPGSYVWRASGTLTYENALACLLALAALLAVAILVDRWTPAVAAALCLTLVGLAATQSRGGVLALLCGAVVLVAALGWRPALSVAWRPAVASVIAAVGLVPSAPVSTPPRPLPAVVALCAGVVVAAWPRRHTPVRRAVVAGVALVTLALIGGGMALRFDAAALTSLESRLTLNSRHRVAQHRVALAELAAHPVVGTGPGQADLRWRQGSQTLRARFVHNEYLQVAVELGVVGGVLLATVLAAIARAVWQGRAAGGVPWAGVAAALVATAVHGAFDFVWHLPVIPFIAVLLAGTATVPNVEAGVRVQRDD